MSTSATGTNSPAVKQDVDASLAATGEFPHTDASQSREVKKSEVKRTGQECDRESSAQIDSSGEQHSKTQ